MAKTVNSKQIRNGMMISVAAQVVSLAVSFLLNMIVPKFVDEYQYAYWQTYILYINYVGVLHFGILDGIVLRYSQFDYEELDKPRIRSQFVVLFLLDVILAGVTIATAYIISGGISRTIVVLVSLGIITRNVFTYTSYTFQTTNRIGKYAMLVIAQRLFFGVGILCFLAFGGKDFTYLCLLDLAADVFGVLLGSRHNKGLYFGKLIKLPEIVQETKINIAVGALLLIANLASNLLIGSAEMIVQWRWDTLVFGKVAFAFSVSNLFLNFITAISIVLFPSLKRMSQESLPGVYQKIRSAISPLMLFVMLLYFPGCAILKLWLPKYEASLRYLGILLPFVVFASKVSLLTNNYLKAYRKEMDMLKVNLLSITVGVALYLLVAYVFDSIEWLLVSIVFTIMLRSILSEAVIMKTISVHLEKEFSIEAVMTGVFIFCTGWVRPAVGFALYGMALLGYFALHKNDMRFLLSQFKK